MKTMKILSLAALTALAFGVGGAMAQNALVPAATQSQAAASQTQGTVTGTQGNTVQYGSSDHWAPAPFYPDTDRTGGGF